MSTSSATSGHAAAWSVVAQHRCGLGESPFWHPHEQQLYWVDIPGRQVLRANIYMGTVETWDMPSDPGCIAPAASGGLVLALRDGIYRATEWRGALTRIATLPYDTATMRANDGQCDALGRLWVGTIDETKTAKTAALFCIDARGSRTGAAVQITQHVVGALTGNGLGWSPDKRTLYWADTPTHTIRAWDFDLEAGSLSGERPFANTPPKPEGWAWNHSTGYHGRPDGAAIDSQGHYFAAMFEGHCLAHYAPTGELVEHLDLPALCPTMPCFGGEDLRTLYVTTASKGRSEAELLVYPASGMVLSRRVEVPGLPVQCFVD
ncbi:SMP-30/gluconolactonase/LRE family protein [Curvibacter sp. CHRR-16]|uniref:SMP-30/gluconolactonase/LRE family protein n=1 Tax=Curvibacter sp. CHRR-16 TaxID=2835872 RepID=UPI001BD95E00|nr:SMP-30/gluconolactonase/LRE family protein [Curvibacter sp. CHRR-16]MBT0570099.1 SMP-30/gluconolactonase/LRE family protein [Curvibacter sp. CHRR-16]